MPYLTARWLTMKSALQTFLTECPDSVQRTQVHDWIYNVTNPGRTEADLESALGQLSIAAADLADATATNPKRFLRLIQGAAAGPVQGAITRITNKANQGKLNIYLNRTGTAGVAAGSFINSLRGSDPKDPSLVLRILGGLRYLAAQKPDKVTLPIDSLIESMSRYAAAHPTSKSARLGPPFTDPSSFWPSSYISSTSTSGGGFMVLRDTRPPKKQAGKKKAAAKKAVPKKKAPKA